MPLERFEALLTALDRVSGELSQKAIFESIAAGGSFEPTMARDVYFAIRLITDRDFNFKGAHSFAEHLVDTLVNEKAITGDSKAETLARFQRIGPRRLLEIYNAARNLMVRNNKNFRTSKGVTEMRPVFIDGVEQEPAAYVVEHQIQITFARTDARHSEVENLFVALDADDLDQLIATLTRCKSKGRVLETQLENMKVPYMKTTA